MGIIEEQKIKFRNIISGGVVRKTVDPVMANEHFEVICHISRFKSPDLIQSLIDNVTLAIEGDFDEIDDPDVSNTDDVAFITADGVEFWDENVDNVFMTYPLSTYKEMLIAWRDFLLTEPFNGTKAN